MNYNKRLILSLIIIGLISIIFGISSNVNDNAVLSMNSEEEAIYKGRVEPLRDGKRYVNPFPSIQQKKTSPRESFRAHRKEKGVIRPTEPLPIDFVDISKALPNEKEGLHVTWLGHSAILIQIDGVNIMIDPVFKYNVSPIPLITRKRFQKELPINLDEIPYLDAVFISHNHFDHLDKGAIKQLSPKTTAILVPQGVGKLVKKWVKDDSKIREYTWWQEDEITGISGGKLQYVCTPAHHYTSRSLIDRNKTLWASWVFIGSQHRVFYSGDTSEGFHFKQIGYHYGPFDLTMIDSGQYNELWADVHLMPESAIQAHVDLKGWYYIPVHWGVYALALHNWWEPGERSVNEARKKGVNILTPRMGQTLLIDSNTKTDEWWQKHAIIK